MEERNLYTPKRIAVVLILWILLAAVPFIARAGDIEQSNETQTEISETTETGETILQP